MATCPLICPQIVRKQHQKEATGFPDTACHTMALLQARVTEQQRWRHRPVIKDGEGGSVSVGSGKLQQERKLDPMGDLQALGCSSLKHCPKTPSYARKPEPER